MKFRNFATLLILLAITFGALGLAILLLVSWFIWVPVLLLLSPVLAVVFLLFKYTKVKTAYLDVFN